VSRERRRALRGVKVDGQASRRGRRLRQQRSPIDRWV
jgi:hypothetical protein